MRTAAESEGATGKDFIVGERTLLSEERTLLSAYNRLVFTDAARGIEFWWAQWSRAVRMRIEESPVY